MMKIIKIFLATSSILNMINDLPSDLPARTKHFWKLKGGLEGEFDCLLNDII